MLLTGALHPAGCGVSVEGEVLTLTTQGQSGGQLALKSEAESFSDGAATHVFGRGPDFQALNSSGLDQVVDEYRRRAGRGGGVNLHYNSTTAAAAATV